MPTRRRLSRIAGSSIGPNCVSVTRKKLDNPFKIDGVNILDASQAVERFETMLNNPDERHALGYPSDQQIIDELSGKDVACFCELDQPCHGDVLLKIANMPVPEDRKPIYAHCLDCGYEWPAAHEMPSEEKQAWAFEANTIVCPYCGESNIHSGIDPNSPKIT